MGGAAAGRGGGRLRADSNGQFVCRILSVCPACACFFAALLADGLQGVQGAFDVADLRCQAVYGLHGAIQLLAAGHQGVHALQEGEK